MSNASERAHSAHSAAFALLTAALSDPAEGTLRAVLTAQIREEQDPGKTLVDVIETLTWHAAGALVTHSGGIDAALETVREAALLQAAKDQGGDTDEHKKDS